MLRGLLIQVTYFQVQSQKSRAAYVSLRLFLTSADQVWNYQTLTATHLRDQNMKVCRIIPLKFITSDLRGQGGGTVAWLIFPPEKKVATQEKEIVYWSKGKNEPFYLMG